PPVIERAIHAASIGVIQGLTIPTELIRGLRDTYYPPPGRPDIVKAYQPRRRLPVRQAIPNPPPPQCPIFFPTHHDLLSPAVLPCLFTIHGGGFTLGTPADDDAWNRSFADTASVLVIALNYSKAPWSAFPHPLLDVEALYHACLSDASLPLDPSRTALCGFDAGANLALALSQLPSVRAGYLPRTRQRHPQNPFPTPYHLPTHPFPPPRAVIPICGLLDFSTAPALKAPSRPYKPTLAAPRGWGPSLDLAARLLPSSAWSYIPYGHDVSDPLLSPAFAPRRALPPHVMVVAAELDCLAHESWRAACAWAGRAMPDRETPVGRRGVARARGCLDDGRGPGGGKFAWGEEHDGGAGTTRWLLVPDVMHGFESAGWRTRYMWADEEGRRDAEMKTYACQREMADWLWGVVWK
ncbi:Alpha/Beta hydrolase protein, partial [Schizothecium vesticola]